MVVFSSMNFGLSVMPMFKWTMNSLSHVSFMRFYFILFFDSLPFWFSLKSQDSGLVGPVPLFGLYTCIERN